MHDELPVELHFTHGRFVFRGYKTAAVFVIPGFADGKRLVGEIEVVGREPKRFGESESGFRDEEDEPIPTCLSAKIKIGEHSVQLKLVEILHFLDTRLLAFDDDLACRIAGNEPFVNGIEDGAFDLVMKIHGGLSLMMLRVTVDKPLISGPIHISKLQLGNKLSEPGLRKSVFAHGHVSDGTFLVRFHPLGVVVAEQRFRSDGFLHGMHLSQEK